ncbi:hypothetical protein HYDPIDRAFT_186460 [Hydnomerulius pinastri MD-312]|nr:hypothetical protein HYDPIDRAFT_186460 [Hydnomerulius pinastri MD-312]
MSLLRLPFVVVAAAIFHIIATPPEKYKTSEQVYASSNEDWVNLQNFTLKLLKISCWAGAIAESASTLSFHLSDTHVPDLLKSLRGPPTQPPNLLFLIAATFVLGGGILRRLCYITLGRFFTFHLTIRKAHTLITTGPYAYVRHPSYTGFLMCYIGLMVMHASPGSWMRESGVLGHLVVQGVVGLWVVFAVAISRFVWKRTGDEDRMLRNAFGEKWETWAGRVRYRLVPGVY